MSVLLIKDLFHTFQGEGFHSGRRALFVRLPFCNLTCSWCDTSFNSYHKYTTEEFTEFALQEAHRFAVITGGEPTLNKFAPIITNILHENGFTVACESNGTAEINADYDFITISPKEDSKNHNMPPWHIHHDAFAKASEFKYVVDDTFDFNILKRHNIDDGRIYSLSPEFGGFNKNLEKIFKYIQENPKWKISLQTHKFMNIP